MHLLQKHFEKVRKIEETGLPVRRGVYYDVGGTLIQGLPPAVYEPLVLFARWSQAHKIFSNQTIFTNDLVHSGELIKRAGLDVKEFGVERAVPKQRIYNETERLQIEHNAPRYDTLETAEEKGAYIPEAVHCLELVVDDKEPEKGIKDTDMVVTWWNPHNPDIKRFLENKEYLGFKL